MDDIFIFKFPNCQLAADPDPNVKNGAELLDRLVKVSVHWLFIFIIITIYDPGKNTQKVVCISQEKGKKFIYCICSAYKFLVEPVYSKVDPVFF